MYAWLSGGNLKHGLNIHIHIHANANQTSQPAAHRINMRPTEQTERASEHTQAGKRMNESI